MCTSGRVSEIELPDSSFGFAYFYFCNFLSYLNVMCGKIPQMIQQFGEEFELNIVKQHLARDSFSWN